MITIRQMRYFEALASTLHFGRAAEAVNVSQPALSTQIAEMERLLDVQLVERARSGVILTREGEELVPAIRDVLSRVEQIAHRARSSKTPLAGTIRLGVIPTVAPYLVPELIPEARVRYPLLNLELRETVTALCLDELKRGRLDCAIVALPATGEGFEESFLFEDRFLIASADDETTILASPMTEDNVDVERLLLLEEGHCLRDQALAVCGVASGRRVANFGATSMATLLQMVSHGMGITLIPEIALKDESSRNRLRIARFAEPQPSRRIGLVWRSSADARRRDFEALAGVITSAARALFAAPPEP